MKHVCHEIGCMLEQDDHKASLIRYKGELRPKVTTAGMIFKTTCDQVTSKGGFPASQER